MNRRRGPGCFGWFIGIAILALAAAIIFAIIAVQNGLFKNPFEATTKVEADKPVVAGLITKQFKIISAEVVGQTVVDGQTSNIIPFSTEKWSYQAIMTVTVGVDMTKLNDSDVTVDENTKTVTIKMPEPEILTQELKGNVISKNSELFSGPSSDPSIIDKMQEVARQKILASLTKDDKLFSQARYYAEGDLRNFLLQLPLGYQHVNFIYKSQTTVTPGPTFPPR